jgi:hypothetical protein
MVQLNQGLKKLDLQERTRRQQHQQARKSPSKKVRISPRVRGNQDSKVKRSPTRPNTERRVRVIRCPKSLRLLKQRKLQAQMVKICQKRKGHKLPRTQSRSIDQKDLHLKEKLMRLLQLEMIKKSQKRKREKRRNLQRTLSIKTQWNMLKRKNLNPSGKSTEMVIGEGAQVRHS